MKLWMLGLLIAQLGVLVAGEATAAIVVAQGEHFTPKDKKGWKVTHQDDSYASHTYGGMWVVEGGLMGAPADSNGSVAVKKVKIPEAGNYRVWSKYQSPPYYNFLHKIEVVQKGKTVFSHVYGKIDADRMWSFSAGINKQLWWFWGVDHDAAEAPKQMVKLAAGNAEIRLVTVKNVDPAGDPMVDFVVLTTEPADTYTGFKPYKTGSPFCLDACKTTELYIRFKNSSSTPAQLQIRKPIGHFQPNYGGFTLKIPDAPVAAGQWSGWINIGPKLTLLHDEGLNMSIKGAGKLDLEFALDSKGKRDVGKLTINNNDPVVIPVDITWRKGKKVRASRDHALEIARLAKSEWRTANKGEKPRTILYYGAFANKAPWCMDLKDTIGYNTLLPDKYKHIAVDGYHQHCQTMGKILSFAKKLGDKKSFKIMSFGDEIHLGTIKWDDPKNQEKFVAWIKKKGLTKKDLGVNPAAAKLADRATKARIGWYATMFNEEEQFARFRAMTAATKREIGPQVETGANYSPHLPPQYYGPIYQWIDIFKHNGMTMYWAEDYVFSVAQPPQFISWMFATVRCATKYNNQKVHFYIMPHAPGQIPANLRRGMVFAVGAGANSIDNFWVAPAENFTENFVAWDYKDMFQTLHESIYDSAEAEPYQVGGTFRPARVAILISKATDYNERRAALDINQDKFIKMCSNTKSKAKGKTGWDQVTIGRVDQQLLYLALKHDQRAVDLITEEDILEGRMKTYDVLYTAGQWIDHGVPSVLEKWIKRGGVLYSCAGLGIRNEFDEKDSAMARLLGLKSSSLKQTSLTIRPFLELPLTEPIDTITLGDKKIGAIAIRQELVPADATVIGTWSNGKPAVTMRKIGKGKAFAVGTAAGHSYLKTGVRKTPWARGGRKMVYNPTGFDAGATELALLGVNAKELSRDVMCSNQYVETLVIDNKNGTLLTLVNWDNNPVEDMEVTLSLPFKPKSIRSVQQQKNLKGWTYADGKLTLKTDLQWADYLLLPK